MSEQEEAAGGLLWRAAADHPGLDNPSTDDVEIALVHRPRYDDWSLPKGKLETGEHPLLAGLREVDEETGLRVVLGRPLGETTYLKRGLPKRVRYWAMRWRDGAFTPNAEVDRLDWVSAEDAVGRLSFDHDGAVVERFLDGPPATRAFVVIRHASAGKRSRWKGDDDDRPLDTSGQNQAAAIADLLAAYDVRRLVSSHVVRCRDTLAPYAARAGIEVDDEPLFSERGFAADPARASRRAADLAREPGAVAVCTQRGALPDLVVGLCSRLGAPAPGLGSVEKGAAVVLHLAGRAVVSVEELGRLRGWKG